MTDGPGDASQGGNVWRPPADHGWPPVPSAAGGAPLPADSPPAADGPRPRARGILGSLWFSLLLAAVVGAIAGGLVTLATRPGEDAGRGNPDASPATVHVEISSAITEAAARAMPSVVRIESATRRTLDVGSGVVISSDGYIVTNAHVVMGTDQLKVVLPDGSERPAVLIGHDFPFNDIAVLQVAPVGLTPIEVGDSERLRPGETVIAIGNPLGELFGSVTAGVVSGLNRSRVLNGIRHDDLIQLDAPVNSGNSGGALVNLTGQFVGMPTTILRQAGSGAAIEGVAFAIPSKRVMEIAGQIIAARGPIARPSLQAEHLDLDDETAARLPAITAKSGAVIMTLVPGGAAADAGLRAGDVIVQVGDTPVDAQTPLLNALVRHRPGETVKVVLNRNGRIIEAEVRLAQR